MPPLTKTLQALRTEHLHCCRSQFTREEIENGARCQKCQRLNSLARSNAARHE